MAIDTESLKASTDLVAVVGNYTPLTKKGNEFVGRCVAHADGTPSMSVSPQKNFVHCFACGFHADVIEFIQEVEHLDFKAACEFLGAKSDWKPKLSVPQAPPVAERVTLKPPVNSQPKTFNTKELGEPSATWAYRDENGDILGYVCRYDTKNGKEIRVWTYAKRGLEDAKWGCGHFNNPRPLYGLDRLAKSPDKPVIIVEGEKSADAAEKLAPLYVPVTWSGGAQSWAKHNLEPLRNKRVLLMPDNDEAGRECMAKLAIVLSDKKGLNCAIKILDTNGMDKGWDIADALADGWDNAQFMKWAKPRVSVFKDDEVEASAIEPPEQELPPLPDELPPNVTELPELPKPKTAPKLAVVKTPASTTTVGNTIVKVPQSEVEIAIAPKPMSPDHLAMEFADQYHQDWQYVHEFGKWLNWNGDTWVTDKTKSAFDCARQLARSAVYWPDIKALSEKEQRGLTQRGTIGGFLDIAATDRRIASSMEIWDKDNGLLGVPGGVYDLKNGTPIAGAREQYISRQTEVAPIAGDCPIWLSVLDRATGGSKDMLNYLHRVAGYMTTGETKEECFFFVYGPGASGKSTFCRTLKEILKDYGQGASMDAFMARANAEHATEIARMAGARLIIATETEEGARWNESRIKTLTGSDVVSARFMRGDLFDFKPTAKIMIAGNHKPQLRSVGEEMKRRIHLIDFPTTIPERERDRDLAEKLKAEYPQILNWMIQGAALWYANGLQKPESVVQATKEYLEDEDGYSAWMDENCVIGSNETTSVHTAYNSFKTWCENAGEYVPSQKRFTQRLVDRGFHRVKKGTPQLEGFSMKAATNYGGYYD